MLLTNMVRLRSFFSSSIRTQNKIKELFGETEKVGREKVLNLDQELMKRGR